MLLKTRSGLLALPKEGAAVAAGDAAARGWSLAVVETQRPVNGQEAEKTASLEVIPMPKSILPGSGSAGGGGGGQKHGASAESYYQCDQCQVGQFAVPVSKQRISADKIKLQRLMLLGSVSLNLLKIH